MKTLPLFCAALFCVTYVYGDDTTTVEIADDGIVEPGEEEKTIIAYLGQGRDLQCTVTNRPNPPTGKQPTVRWMHYGTSGWVELSSDTSTDDSSRIKVKEDESRQRYTITIISVGVDDGGRYQCKIQTQDKTFVKANVLVVVHDKAAINELGTSKSQTRNKGDKTLVFTCAATGIPPPVVTWVKVGGAMRSGIDQNSTIGSNSMIFDSVQPDDRGKYRCTAKNAVNTASWEVELGVRYPPMITGEKGDSIPQALRYEAFIVCKVEANPGVTSTKWSFKSQEITNEKVSKDIPYKRTIKRGDNGLDMILVIPKVRKQDIGDYSCSADNTLGSFEKTIKLIESTQPQETRAGEANSSSRSRLTAFAAVMCLIVVSLRNVLC